MKSKIVPEKVIENQILVYLNSKRIFAFKNQSVGIFDPVKKIYRKSNNKFHIKGTSDILGVLPHGRFLAIEVKTRYGKTSPEQLAFIERINHEGGLAFIARDLETVIEKLKGII